MTLEKSGAEGSEKYVIKAEGEERRKAPESSGGIHLGGVMVAWYFF